VAPFKTQNFKLSARLFKT